MPLLRAGQPLHTFEHSRYLCSEQVNHFIQSYIWAFKVPLLRAGQSLHTFEHSRYLCSEQVIHFIQSYIWTFKVPLLRAGQPLRTALHLRSRCLCSERVNHFIQTTWRPSHCPKAVCQWQPYIWAVWLCPISWGMDAKELEYVLYVMTALKSLSRMWRYMMNSKKPELEYGLSLLRPLRDGSPEIFKWEDVALDGEFKETRLVHMARDSCKHFSDIGQQPYIQPVKCVHSLGRM